MTLQANSIEEVIAIMNDIIQDAMSQQTRLGYFASLYRTVTIVVKERCDEGFFEDNDRMRELDTIFANRYFVAYDCFQKNSGTASDCWTASFEVIENESLLILQHLLLGMNAHIALDLGVATAQVAQGELTESLKRDFYRLNHLLAGLIDVVQKEVSEASPLLHYLDKWAWRIDETFVSFGINIARDTALDFAEELIALPEDQWQEAIEKRDKKVGQFARRILASTKFPFALAIWFVNLRESKDARFVTQAMSNEIWQNKIKKRLDTLIDEAEAQGIDLTKRDTQLIKIPEQLME